MRKGALLFLATVLILGAVVGLVPRARAEQGHASHCVCGGNAKGVGDHVCQQVSQTWQPLTGTVNFGELESGYYYLAEDITVTSEAGVLIGDLVVNNNGTANQTADDYYELERAEHIHLCLNGHTITASGGSRVFHGVAQQSSLSICDCSYQNGVFGGCIVGGTSGSGGILYTYAGSQTNIYGGNFTGKTGNTNNHGGLIVVAQDRGSVAQSTKVSDQFSTLNIYNGLFYGGSSKNGGNINVMHYCKVNMYGGEIRSGSADNGGNFMVGKNSTLTVTGGKIWGGSANVAGGNICGSAQVNLVSASVYDGALAEKPEAFRVIRDGKYLAGDYTTLTAAAEQAAKTDNAYIKLLADVQDSSAVSQDICLDLNGHTLEGIAITGKLSVIDTATDGYKGEKAGALIPASGKPQIYTQTEKAKVGFAKQYLAVEDHGSYSFHRFTMSISKLTLQVENRGFGYKATFKGSPELAAYLQTDAACGYNLWLDGLTPFTNTFPAQQLTQGGEVPLLLNNFISEAATAQENNLRGQEMVYANVYLKLADGTVVTGQTVSYSFRQMLEMVDGRFGQYNDQQQTAVLAMSKTFWESFIGWDIPELHHVEGVWKEVDAATFTDMLSASGSYYNIPKGNYVLTEDVDLGEKALRVAGKTTVSICLNGHEIRSAKRVFRAYGTLNICDCHKNGQEGTVCGTATLAAGSEEKLYAPVLYVYYNGQVNLYGGTLKATGRTTAGGVIAISHDGAATEANKPGVFNMYGGSITGGYAETYSGLVAMWHESTFNMYGGTLTSGEALEDGGALMVSNGCTFNMYGGTITGNKAGEVGGAVTAKGTVNLYNDVRITDNDGPDLSVYLQGLLGQINLTEGAKIELAVDGQGLVSKNAYSITGLESANTQYKLVLNGTKLLLKDPNVSAPKPVDTFSAGYSRVCINPEELGLELSGYGNGENRKHTEIGKSLYVTTLAVTDETNNTVLIIGCDLQRPQEEVTDALRMHISEITGVPTKNIYITATHTHSTPNLYSTAPNIVRYLELLRNRFVQSAAQAMADRKACTMEVGSFEVEGLNFTRHYQYTDANGVVQYFGDNFGTAVINSTTKHVSEGDHTMHLLAFYREGDDILLSNWRAHPTMTGGATKTVLSADYVGPLRDQVEAETGMKFIFVQGAAGNMNVNSRIPAERHSYDHKQYGQALAKQLVAGMSCLEPVESGLVQTSTYKLNAYVNHEEDGRYEDALYVQDNYWKLTDTEARKQMLTEYGFSSVYHANAIVAKSKMGEYVPIELNAFSIGKHLGFFTAPGELWSSISMEMEENSPFDTTFTVGYSNGDQKYFLYDKALDYVSYEGVYCRFLQRQTVAGMLSYWKEALNTLFEKA